MQVKMKKDIKDGNKKRLFFLLNDLRKSANQNS